MNAAEEPSKPALATAPLLSIGPMNHGNNKSKSIDSVATLSIVLVKPTSLHKISNAAFSDADMTKFD